MTDHHIPAGRLNYWGTPDEVREVLPGILWVTTASHGGFVLSDQRQAEVPEYLREPDAVYEEDCDWCIPVIAFDIAKEFAQEFTHKDPERVMQQARETLRLWHPKRWERFTAPA